MSEKIEEVDTDLLLPVNAEDNPVQNPTESPEFDDSEPTEG